MTLSFGTNESGDAWADAQQDWWELVRSDQGHVERLVIYLDNGPKNSEGGRSS